MGRVLARLCAAGLVLVALLGTQAIGTDVARAQVRTPKQINGLLAQYLGVPTFNLHRGLGPGMPATRVQAFWNPGDQQMHVSPYLYRSLRQSPVDRKAAMAFAVLAHEMGHVGQPGGELNSNGGLDQTAAWQKRMEDEADAYARQNVRKIINLFFTRPHERQVMAKWAVKKLDAFRHQNPYTEQNV